LHNYESISSSSHEENSHPARHKLATSSKRTKLQYKKKRSKVARRKVRISPSKHLHISNNDQKSTRNQPTAISSSDNERMASTPKKKVVQRSCNAKNSERTLRSDKSCCDTSIKQNTPNLFNSKLSKCLKCSIHPSLEVDELYRMLADEK
jgi:hypothetical protein